MTTLWFGSPLLVSVAGPLLLVPVTSPSVRLFWSPLPDPFSLVPTPPRFVSPLLATVAGPLLLLSYGLPFGSPLLGTVARPLVSGTYGVPFGSPLLVTVASSVSLGYLCPLLWFVSFGHRCWTLFLGTCDLPFGSPLPFTVARPPLSWGFREN